MEGGGSFFSSILHSPLRYVFSSRKIPKSSVTWFESLIKTSCTSLNGKSPFFPSFCSFMPHFCVCDTFLSMSYGSLESRRFSILFIYLFCYMEMSGILSFHSGCLIYSQSKPLLGMSEAQSCLFFPIQGTCCPFLAWMLFSTSSPPVAANTRSSPLAIQKASNCSRISIKGPYFS